MILDKENLFAYNADASGGGGTSFPDVIDLGADSPLVSQLKERGGEGKIFISMRDIVAAGSSISFYLESSDDPAFGSGVLLGDYIDVSTAKYQTNPTVQFEMNVSTQKRYVRLTHSAITSGTVTAGFVFDAHDNSF